MVAKESLLMTQKQMPKKPLTGGKKYRKKKYDLCTWPRTKRHSITSNQKKTPVKGAKIGEKNLNGQKKLLQKEYKKVFVGGHSNRNHHKFFKRKLAQTVGRKKKDSKKSGKWGTYHQRRDEVGVH